MNETDIWEKILISAVARANREIPGFRIDTPSLETPLFGVSDARLDSFSLVSFVFLLEKAVAEATGAEIRLTAQDVLTDQDNPFANFRSLAAFLSRKLRAP